MNEAAFQSELQYQAAVSIAKRLLRQGLLTGEEYAAMDTALAAAFEPILLFPISAFSMPRRFPARGRTGRSALCPSDEVNS